MFFFISDTSNTLSDRSKNSQKLSTEKFSHERPEGSSHLTSRTFFNFVLRLKHSSYFKRTFKDRVNLFA